MSDRSPTLAGLLNRVMNRTMEELRVALPAKIVSYDAAKQTADVQPLIKETYENEEGETVSESIPVITSVPIIFPSGGGMRMTFPMSVGDTVMLVFSDRSLDVWQAQGNESDPVDQRRHHITDAVAFPGLHANNAPWSGAEAGVITIGSNSGTAQFAARADRTDAELAALKNTLAALVTAHNTHIHVLTLTAGTGTAAPPVITGTAPAAQTTVGSATVKIKG